MLATYRVSIFAVATFFVLVLLFRSLPSDVPTIKHITNISYGSAKPSIGNAILTLFDSIRHPITEDYTDVYGTAYPLEHTPVWTKPLKKKILVVDIDTREPTGENQLLNNSTLNWDELEMEGPQLVSNGMMNHFLYAQIHGYDYRFFQAQDIEGHHATWILPHVLLDLIDDYQFIVAMDADVTLTHLEVPLEWMFNRWGINKNTSISMPWDTEEKSGNVTMSVDSKGLQVLNTGLVIVQNLDLTKEMLDVWKDCTTEKRYKGCAEWKEKWSHEQRAFSEYIRYDFNPDGNNIVPIPCDDAMGWPGMIKDYPGRITSDCNGNFMRHHTLRKDQTKNSASLSVMQALSEILQKTLLEHQDKLWVKEAKQNKTEGLSDLDRR